MEVNNAPPVELLVAKSSTSLSSKSIRLRTPKRTSRCDAVPLNHQQMGGQTTTAAFLFGVCGLFMFCFLEWDVFFLNWSIAIVVGFVFWELDWTWKTNMFFLHDLETWCSHDQLIYGLHEPLAIQWPRSHLVCFPVVPSAWATCHVSRYAHIDISPSNAL